MYQKYLQFLCYSIGYEIKKNKIKIILNYVKCFLEHFVLEITSETKNCLLFYYSRFFELLKNKNITSHDAKPRKIVALGSLKSSSVDESNYYESLSAHSQSHSSDWLVLHVGSCSSSSSDIQCTACSLATKTISLVCVSFST